MNNGPKKWNSAVIGYGGAFNMGKRHADYMQKYGFELAAVCELNPQRLEQASRDFPGIRTFTRVEDMLREGDIDLVTVITPHNTHYPLAVQVLESGKHCILEKPMCIRAGEADELIRKAAEKQKMISVYQNRRWDGWYLTVKDLIARGVIGEIFEVDLSFIYFGDPGQWGPWRADKVVSGGTFYDWGAHIVDWLLGIVPSRVTTVKGVVQNRIWNQYTIDDQMDSMVYFENGAFAHLQVSYISRAAKPRRIIGTKGSITDHNDGHLLLNTEMNGVSIETKVPYQTTRHEAFYENIADHLMNGAELIVQPEQVRRAIAVIEATEISAREGKELTLK